MPRIRSAVSSRVHSASRSSSSRASAAGRPQMAEALFNRLVPDDVRAESAGQEPRREGVWPAVVEVMREIGIDLASKRPKRLMPEMQLHADWAVTLACGVTCPYVPT